MSWEVQCDNNTLLSVFSTVYADVKGVHSALALKLSPHGHNFTVWNLCLCWSVR